MENIKTDGQIELSKRFYPGVKIKRQCPNCGHEIHKDLTDDYLSYPVTNNKEQISMYCDECDTEYTIDVIVRLSLDVSKNVVKY